MTLPAGLALLGRIQAQMRAVAHRQYEAAFVPPFTLFFHATDPLPFFNYAIPDGPGAALGNFTAPLDRLEAEFHARRRVPRFEFVEACAPRRGSRGARLRAGEPGAAHGLPARKRARRAGRVYEAAGFSPAGHSLFYRRPEEHADTIFFEKNLT